MRRSDGLWAASLLALLLVGYGIIPLPESGSRSDSFSSESAGKKAFFLLTAELLEDVRRSDSSLVPEASDADTLVLLGPAQYPDRAQCQTLFDWVQEGHSLLVAARWEDPVMDLEPFGIDVRPRQREDLTGGDGFHSDLVEGFIDWRSSGEILFAENQGIEVAASDNGHPQLVWRQVGNGILVVAASDFIFTNASLTRHENGLLAFRALELAAPLGPVYFDETLNAAGAPRVVGILFQPPFRLLTLQVLVIVVLYGWMASRRFGPPAGPAQAARRSLIEHAQALGTLHYKAGGGPRLIGAYLEFFRNELGSREEAGNMPSSSTGAVASSEVSHAIRACKQPNLSTRHAAAILRSLALYRRRKD